MEATGSGRWERRPLANHDASIKSNMSPFQTVTVINASETHVLSPPLGPLFLLISLPLTNIYSVCLFLSPAAGEHTHGAALWNNCCLFFKRPSPCCLFSSCLCSLLIFFFFWWWWKTWRHHITSRLICVSVWTYLTSWRRWRWSSLSIEKKKKHLYNLNPPEKPRYKSCCHKSPHHHLKRENNTSTVHWTLTTRCDWIALYFTGVAVIVSTPPSLLCKLACLHTPTVGFHSFLSHSSSLCSSDAEVTWSLEH